MERVKRVFVPVPIAGISHRALAIVLLSVTVASVGNAQMKRPADEDQSFKFGIEAGNGWHKQLGEFSGPCGCALEEGATGSGFVGSLLVELPSVSSFTFGLKAGIDYKNATGSRQQAESVVIINPSTIDTGYVLAGIPIAEVGTYKLTYLFAAPYVQYRIISEGAFIQIGPSLSILAASHFVQTREMPATVSVQGQTIYNPRFGNSGTSSEVVEDGAIPNVSSLRVSALLSTGWNIPLWGITLAPMVTYDLPLTTVRDQNASGWKVSSLYATVALKFGL